MTVRKHKHAELIKAYADGAEIEVKSYGGVFVPVKNGCSMTNFKMPVFTESNEYRIKPDCEYAIEEIRKLGGDKAVKLYTYWLKGGELEIIPDDHSVYIPLIPSRDFANPFGTFKHELEFGIKFRKKKRTVKQVLWVKVCGEQGVNYGWKHYTDSFAGCIDEELWHKVPTCTREIEVD